VIDEGHQQQDNEHSEEMVQNDEIEDGTTPAPVRYTP